MPLSDSLKRRQWRHAHRMARLIWLKSIAWLPSRTTWMTRHIVNELAGCSCWMRTWTYSRLDHLEHLEHLHAMCAARMISTAIATLMPTDICHNEQMVDGSDCQLPLATQGKVWSSPRRALAAQGARESQSRLFWTSRQLARALYLRDQRTRDLCRVVGSVARRAFAALRFKASVV